MFSDEDVKYTKLLLKRPRASQKKGLLISFYIFLPLLILIALITLKCNKKKIFQDKEGTVSEE